MNQSRDTNDYVAVLLSYFGYVYNNFKDVYELCREDFIHLKNM